jgi:hypothetical protein
MAASVLSTVQRTKGIVGRSKRREPVRAMTDAEGEVATPQNALASATAEIVQAARAVLPHSRADDGGPPRGGMPSSVAAVPMDANARLGSPENPVGPKQDQPGVGILRTIPLCVGCHLYRHIKWDSTGNIHCSWPKTRLGNGGGASAVGASSH